MSFFCNTVSVRDTRTLSAARPAFLAAAVTAATLLSGVPAMAETTAASGEADASSNMVVCTIFANNSDSSWDFSSKEDQDKLETVRNDLSNACGVLEGTISGGSQNLHFIWDFEENDELSYQYYTGITAGTEKWDKSLFHYIDSNIDIDGLLSEYDAQNVIFVTCMNGSTLEYQISSELTGNELSGGPEDLTCSLTRFVTSGKAGIDL